MKKMHDKKGRFFNKMYRNTCNYMICLDVTAKNCRTNQNRKSKKRTTCFNLHALLYCTTPISGGELADVVKFI